MSFNGARSALFPENRKKNRSIRNLWNSTQILYRTERSTDSTNDSDLSRFPCFFFAQLEWKERVLEIQKRRLISARKCSDSLDIRSALSTSHVVVRQIMSANTVAYKIPRKALWLMTMNGFTDQLSGTVLNVSLAQARCARRHHHSAFATSTELKFETANAIGLGNYDASDLAVYLCEYRRELNGDVNRTTSQPQVNNKVRTLPLEPIYVAWTVFVRWTNKSTSCK